MVKKFIKDNWKSIVFFIVAGLIGGFFVGIYLLESYPPEIKQQVIDEMIASGVGGIPVDLAMGILSSYQGAGYGLVLGVVGIILAKKIGLWRNEIAITRKPLLITSLVGVLGGLLLILPDLLYFNHQIPAIKDSYASKPTIAYIIGAILYGGVTEEVMLRLFWMSLVAFLLYKLFERKQEKPSVRILVIANIIAAILFAAGHLPATFMLIGNSPMILIRCFVLNGGLGLLFGWLYRKYGLRYAMIAHAGCHIVSKVIWILFI